MRVAALMLRNAGRKLPIVVLFFLGIPGLYSQTQSVDMPKTGIFSGNVKDASEAPIPNATIGFTSQRNSFMTKTDKEGRFRLDRRGLGVVQIADRPHEGRVQTQSREGHGWFSKPQARA